MNLSPHFTLREMTRSNEGERRKIDNTPAPSEQEALVSLCENVLEPLRIALNAPIFVSSGFRCPSLNMLTPGSSAKSQHTKGEAADIEVFGFDNMKLAQKIIDLHLPFDQLILEYYQLGSINSGWIHVSHVNHRENKNQVLSAKIVLQSGKRKTVYSPGLLSDE